MEQWELSNFENKVDGCTVRKLKLASQVEGMVSDDETGTLYVGEEDKGIWKFNTEKYPKGILVVQDGSNIDNGISAAQNFKIIRWDSIALKFNPPLNSELRLTTIFTQN